jgi:hypothetical protein
MSLSSLELVPALNMLTSLKLTVSSSVLVLLLLSANVVNGRFAGVRNFLVVEWGALVVSPKKYADAAAEPRFT